MTEEELDFFEKKYLTQEERDYFKEKISIAEKELEDVRNNPPTSQYE